MSSRGRAAALVLVAAIELCASRVRALNFFELEAYRARTDGQGAMYVESFNTTVPRGSREHDDDIFPTEDIVRSSLEVNYGVTQNVDLAVYLDTAKPEGHDFRYAGVRLRGRGFIVQDMLPIDLGWYAELELPDRRFAEEDAAFELRGIVSQAWHRFSVRLNPSLEQAFNGEEAGKGPQFQYAARVSYALFEPVTVALESFGDVGPLSEIRSLSNQQHYVLPLLKLEPFEGFEIAAGPGFGLTRSSDDLFIKFVLEYKFHVSPPPVGK